MTKPKRRLWDKFRNGVLTPTVDEQQLADCLRRIHRDLPTPVFWLLGNSQSGKTSLIRALTGSSRAEIGSGVRPCTRTAQMYAFPNEPECFLRFLDTRGLGEVDYDPSEDMQVLENQAHLLIVVVKAMDHAQQTLLAALKKIRRAHPSWPLIVVQTSLHEGYPTHNTPHILPYPFASFPYPDTVPSDLARSLTRQREWFAGYRARFVPVDLTLREDGFTPEHYGLDALWLAIEEALPEGIRGMIEQLHQGRQELRDMHLAAAHPHIISYALAAGGAAAVPVPFVDIPLVLGIQAKMFHTVASIYRQDLNPKRLAEVASAMGVGFAGRWGIRELAKLVPGFGSAVSAAYAASTTYALGRTLCEYFTRLHAGDVPSPAVFRQLYEEQFREARQWLKTYYREAVQTSGVSEP